MNYNFTYSTVRARSQISGALPFCSDLNQQTPSYHFSHKKISTKSIPIICNQLDRFTKHHIGIEDFIADTNIFIGSKNNNMTEVNRMLKQKPSIINSVLLGFPFKCPVPIKTNYNTYPDLGECMFLYRLGFIAKQIERLSNTQSKIIVLEETDALAPVFGNQNTNYSRHKTILNKYISILKLDQYVKIKSLQKHIVSDRSQYIVTLEKKKQYIKNNIRIYSEQINDILPTILLSLPLNHQSFDANRQYIHTLVTNSVDLPNDSLLYEALTGYLAFIEIQKESNYKNRYFSNYLNLSLCPKDNRLAIRPVVKSARLFPHHGVPLVISNKNRLRFSVEYYVDFVTKFSNKQITKVVDSDSNFLYYEVAC